VICAGFALLFALSLSGAPAGVARARNVMGVIPPSGQPAVFLDVPEVLGSTRAGLSGAANPDGLASAA